MIQLFPEFVIQELQGLLSIVELNNVLNSTVIFKEYKKKYYHWTITSKRGDFRKNYNKIKNLTINKNQISIQIKYAWLHITDYFVMNLGGIHTLNLSGCK